MEGIKTVNEDGSMLDHEDYSFGGEMQNILNVTGQLFSSWPEKLALGATLSSIFAFFGADIVLYYTFLAMTFTDFVLGVTIGCRYHHCIDLHKIGKGIKKLVTFNLYIMLSCIASMTTAHIGLEAGAPYLVNMFIGYLIFHEMISVIRNMEILGFTPPPLLKKFLQRTSRNIEKTIAGSDNKDSEKKEDEKSEDSTPEYERGRDLR